MTRLRPTRGPNVLTGPDASMTLTPDRPERRVRAPVLGSVFGAQRPMFACRRPAHSLAAMDHRAPGFDAHDRVDRMVPVEREPPTHREQGHCAAQGMQLHPFDHKEQGADAEHVPGPEITRLAHHTTRVGRDLVKLRSAPYVRCFAAPNSRSV
jgi:hypothetical protein